MVENKTSGAPEVVRVSSSLSKKAAKPDSEKRQDDQIVQGSGGRRRKFDGVPAEGFHSGCSGNFQCSCVFMSGIWCLGFVEERLPELHGGIFS